jgi:hypothetical protein
MSERGLCWCGLGKDLHDGREVDAQGDMHQFNQPARSTRAEGPFEDPSPKSEAAVVPPGVRKVLSDAKDFFDGRVIRMSRNGFKCPPFFVDAAEDLSKRIGHFLELPQD